MPAAAASLIPVVLAHLIGSVSGSPLLGRGYEMDRRHGSGHAGGTHGFGILAWRADLMRWALAPAVAALVPFAQRGSVQRPHADNEPRFECVRSCRGRA
ncbi:MAG TPA: hypothetical protein VK325_04090 [Pseudoxanthomonas sp.]|nr:hypothetical protein [Pseudoxanthomonas sp.]